MTAVVCLWFASLTFPPNERGRTMSEKYYKAIVNGLFWGQEQVARPLIDELRRYGWSDEEICLVWTNPKLRDQIISQIATRGIVTDGFIFQAHKSIVVKMTCGRTFAESVLAGHYDEVVNKQHINENNFPINGQSSARPLVTPGNGPYRADEIPSEDTTKIVLVDMHGKAKSDEALEYMKRRHLRPIGTRHLLAIGEQHPDIQRQFTVVALESLAVRFGGGDQVLGLNGSASKRILNIFWYATLWNEQTRFGAIAEEAL